MLLWGKGAEFGLPPRALDRQAANERSFQVLQEYLAHARQGGGAEQAPRLYPFELYINRGSTDDGVLEKVVLTLPPPQRSRREGAELPLATRMSLGRLLAACGLSANVSGGLSGDQVLKLSDLFQQASELQRQSENAALTADQNLTVVRNALRMGRGITLQLSGKLGLTCNQHTDLLHRLARRLDEVPDLDLADCTLVLGEWDGLDVRGRICIDCRNVDEGWATWFGQPDTEQARTRRRIEQVRRAKELLVAKLMEVEMLYTSYSTGVTAEYFGFLDGLASGARQDGAVGGGRFHELPIYVTASVKFLGDALGATASNKERPTIHPNMGFITTPVATSHKELYNFIEHKGEEALARRLQYKHAEKRLSQLQSKVRKSLGLKRLEKSLDIREDQFVSACMRMLRFASILQRHTEGLNLCIADEHGFTGGTSPFVYLKWDFSMSDL
eukprot:SM000126S26356  [mRNA]  locus=s126:378850:381028:- [translate_table: standard]